MQHARAPPQLLPRQGAVICKTPATIACTPSPQQCEQLELTQGPTLDRQNCTVVTHEVMRETGTSSAVAALNIRAPSRCTARPRESARAFSLSR